MTAALPELQPLDHAEAAEMYAAAAVGLPLSAAWALCELADWHGEAVSADVETAVGLPLSLAWRVCAALA